MAEARHWDDNRIQMTCFEESRESWGEMNLVAEQYEALDGLALSEEFLEQYFSQVRDCETVR